MRSMHHIEVDRGAGVASYRTAVEYLRAGEAVGIFPEATISRAMELKEFKSGAVRLAADAGVPLVPVVLWGTQRMMTKDHPRDFSRGKTILIRVGEPLHPTGEDPVAETAELHAVMSDAARQGDRGLPGRRAAPGRLVGPGVARRQRALPRGGRPPRRRGEARARRPPRRRQEGKEVDRLVAWPTYWSIALSLCRQSSTCAWICRSDRPVVPVPRVHHVDDPLQVLHARRTRR